MQPFQKLFEGLQSYENRFYSEKSAKNNPKKHFFVQNLAKWLVDSKFFAVFEYSIAGNIIFVFHLIILNRLM